MFQSGLQKADEDWCHCNVASGEDLPVNLLTEFQGVVLTGSHFNVRDASSPESTIKKWFDSVSEFIRQASERGSPRIYGGCFGTQIITAALGGEVDFNPNKRFVFKAETVCFCSTPDRLVEIFHLSGMMDEDDDFIKMEQAFVNQQKLQLIVSHGDCVKTLPPEAEQIGTSIYHIL